MSVFSRSLVAATFLAMVVPAGAATTGQNRLAWVEIAQSAPAGAKPRSPTDPRKPGEPPAAAQPPQEGHSPLPVKPAERNLSETGQPAQSVPPGHKAKP